MIKSAVATWLLLLSAPLAFAEVDVATIDNTPDVAQQGLELIADPTFAAGFSVIPACRNPDNNTSCANGKKYDLHSPLHPENDNTKPAWELAQWGSSTNLQGPSAPFGSGIAWSTFSKRVALYPDGVIEMAVNGEQELSEGYSTARTSSPGLIASETIAAPGTYSRNVGTLASMSRLQFNLDFRVAYDNPVRKPGYDAGRNALIFPINFTVQNLKQGSPGYGQYVWLQVSAFDDRDGIPNKGVDKNMVDEGTKQMIYFVPSKSLTQADVRAQQWVTMKSDLLPYAKRAIQLAFKRGSLKSGDLADYSIGGINIGYELTSLNITTFQFRNLSLRAFY